MLNAHISQSVTPRPKRLIITCDGTWQSAVSLDNQTGAPSNVAKLCRILASAGTAADEEGQETEYQQIVYYDAGVGTGKIGTVMKAVQGGSGAGLLENVIEAYNFIVNNFVPGDKLYFFGFSRGAFTARATAGLVYEVGIVKPSAMRRFIQLYSTYVRLGKFEQKFSDSAQWQEFKEDSTFAITVPPRKQKVEIIGVWDTVGALGVPDTNHLLKLDMSGHRKPFEFHDVQLNDRVHHAFQALALDDERLAFHPAIWQLGPKRSADHLQPELVQCWFSGMHINVGGGSSSSLGEGDSREQLASIAYVWMLDRIRPYLAFDEDELVAQKQDWQASLMPLDEQRVREARRVEESKSYLHQLKTLAAKHFPGAEDSSEALGYAIGNIEDSHGFIYDVMGDPKPRVPLNLGADGAQAGVVTNESVHFSVRIREKKLGDGYTPAALKDWGLIQTADGKHGWQGPVAPNGKRKFLPEIGWANIAEADSLERWYCNIANADF